MKQEWMIPITLESYANKNENRWQEVKRKKRHNAAIDLFFRVQPCEIKPPCKITLVRIGSRLLDYDNLVYAFKRILDHIGSILMPHKAIGQADGSGELKIDYMQSKGSPSRIQIIIEAL